MYRVGIDDGGVPVTVPKCVTEGTRKPDDPCMGCSPTDADGGASNNTKWMPMSGGTCDDKNDCTQNDTCIGGTCKGTSFLKKCADTYGCTKDLCDGKGGCLGNTLMAGWCIIDKICYKKGGKKPDGSCNECDPSVSTSTWTPISSTCKIDSKCYNKGDFNNGKCAVCDPAFSTSAWRAVSGRCYINKVCKKPGDQDAIKCATCDPTKNQYDWTPKSGVCKIDNKCYTKGTKHPLGCAECDPSVSTTSWTVKGSYCLINNKCYNPKATDSIKCGTCDPTKNKYKWTQIAGLCKISGSCYSKGAQHPGKCATCDPTVSSTSWTVSSGAKQCLINNVCKKPGDKDLSGCGQCDPTSNLYKWTSIANTCKIDGACYQNGDKHTGGCAVCNAALSSTSWTGTGSGCIIDGACKSSGSKDGSGCGVCDPTKSKTAWTVSASSCIVGPSKCVSSASKEPGGCGVCTPTKTKSGWTFDAGCQAVHAWSKKFGGSSSDIPYGTAVDTNGNVYITGYFYNSINFGGTTHSTSGGADIFVASFTPSGKYRWSKTFGSTSYDYGYDVAVDKSGNVYVTGGFYSSMNCGGSNLQSKGSNDVFICSFDSAGKHRWSGSWGSTSTDYGYAIGADSNSNVYLTGYHYSSINFGGSTFTSKGSYDIFVASFDDKGKHRWSKGFGSTSSDYGYGMAVDGSGNVYVTGAYYYSMDCGGGTMTSKGSRDIYLCSFSPSGTHRWSKSFGGTSTDYGYYAAVDNTGNVAITGYFYGSVNFGGSTLTSAGGADIFLASFTSSGTHRWSKAMGGTSYDYGYGIAADAKGNIYATGVFYSSMKPPGGTTLTSKGSNDIFIVSYDGSGNFRWARSHGSTSSDYGRKLAVAPNGDLYASGYFYYTVDFGGGNLTASSTDVYLVKIRQK